MEKIKSLTDYTKEEWDSLDEDTQADILWEYQKCHDRMLTLRESLLEYQNIYRIEYW